MTVFLRIHGDGLAEDVRQALGEWRKEQEGEVKRLGELVGYVGGVLGFLRSGRV